MALTSDYHETVQARARRDREFREALLNEVGQCLLAREVVVAKILLRDYIVATVGFEQLGAMTGKSPASLTQMFGPEGDPLTGDLFEVIACMLRHEGFDLQVSTVREKRDEDSTRPERSFSSFSW